MSESAQNIGRFKIVGELGRGAMGVVYRAVDPHLGREVALKLLAPELASDQEMVERFTAEARHASSLIHQNIATVFEAGPSDAGWFVAFELVEGHTLQAILNQGRMELETVRDFLIQTAEGLSAAHKAGVVHRDLKPDNLIITPDGVVKITDFGLAKRIGDPGKTRAGSILGTAYYMAPEQAKGLSVDARADWFSLGAITYEMTTGKRPFDGYHEMAVLYAVVNEDPEPVSSLCPEAPAELVEAISRMLSKEADSRLADIADLKRLLGGSASGTPTASGIVSGISVPRHESTPGGLPVLAVLPLENKSPDSELVYLAEGFAEDIGATLSQCERFEVLSHEKVVAGRPGQGTPEEWGRLLGARYVLSGSLFVAGDRMKLRLGLRDLVSGKLDWTQAFSGNKADIFGFQEEVAEQVAQALTGGEQTVSITPRPGTENSDAYDFFLKGREYYRREGQSNLEFAINMFEKALEIDSKYAAAHAAQADAYAQMYMMYYDRDRKWLKRAETSAKTALIHNPNLPEAHRALGRVMVEYGRKEEAIREFETAISQKPDFHEAYRTLAWIYQGMRRYSDSIDYGQKSLRIKPMDRETYLLLGLNYLDLRDWDKARHHFQRAVELSPDYGRAYMHLGNVKQKTGDIQGALELYRTALKHLTDINAYLDLGWAQILIGDRAGAAESFEHLISEGSLEFVAFYMLGFIDYLDERFEKALGRFESTMNICRKQLVRDPNNAYCLAILAQAQAQLGRHEDSLATASQAAEMEKGNGAITMELARVRAIVGDREGTLEALRSALEQPMGPSFFEIQADPHFSDFDLSDLESNR